MVYNNIVLPEEVRRWINLLKWSHSGHLRENTFTNQERWLLGLTDSQAWSLMKAEPLFNCPLRRTCKLSYEHCENDHSGNPGECWKVFKEWASQPISKSEHHEQQIEKLEEK